jgi:hypothetical protein
MALALILAFGIGLCAAAFVTRIIPVRPEAPPLAAIAATTLLILLLQAAAFLFLALEEDASSWPGTVAFLKTALLGAAAHLGALAASPQGSFRVLLIAWALSAAFAGVFCALHALISLCICRKRLALQAVLVLAIFLNSALFWTRAIIIDSGTQLIADVVMKLSPPVTLSSVWHQESVIAPNAREDARFDLIRSPLTYETWVGSYHAVPYPKILPEAQRSEPYQPGLLLVLFIWALPLLVFAEALLQPRATQKS